MDQEKIDKILHDHKEWLETDGKNGMRANLYGADLRGANLSSAKIQGANFFHANFYGADLPSGIYVAGGIGSMRRNTYYDAVNNCVICGCWDDDAGNHLDSFKKRIEDIYGPDGKTSNPAHYKAYRAAIQYFEACRESYIVGDCHEKED